MQRQKDQLSAKNKTTHNTEVLKTLHPLLRRQTEEETKQRVLRLVTAEDNIQIRPDPVRFEPARPNNETRMRRLKEEKADAIRSQEL